MKRHRTEKEILTDSQLSLFKLEKGLQQQKYSIKEVGELLPGMLHLNRSDDLVLSYFNSWALNRFEKTVDEILELGLEFMVSIFEPGTAFLFSKSLVQFLNENDGSSSHGFFQKLRFNTKREYEWMYTTSKLFFDRNFVFSYSTPISDLETNNRFLLQNLEDNLFLRKNFLKFQSLTKREKEILKLVASSLTSRQIAEQLYLSKATVSTHRKHITQKLELTNINDWIRYSNAFNL
ncbi:response regulator transcription factor [Maribellus comscasis]|nr:helix-turn-helix transcriptional regulator [Maribellus comscasis]